MPGTYGKCAVHFDKGCSTFHAGILLNLTVCLLAHFVCLRECPGLNLGLEISCCDSGISHKFGQLTDY
jgi:hypothetical protein